ncbi:MAG TPA: hypothetical protein VGF43_15570 [Dongiaceae bacterium]
MSETEARVAAQQARIGRLRAAGQPVESAEHLLQALQQTLGLMKAHLGTMTDPAASVDAQDLERRRFRR